MTDEQLQQAAADAQAAIKRAQRTNTDKAIAYYRARLEQRGRVRIYHDRRARLWCAALFDDRRRIIEQRADVTTLGALRQLAREVGV